MHTDHDKETITRVTWTYFGDTNTIGELTPEDCSTHGDGERESARAEGRLYSDGGTLYQPHGSSVTYCTTCLTSR